MTAAREWPNNMAEARDQAAERINNAAVRLDSLLNMRQHDDREIILTAALVKDDLNNALRWLEKAGANTNPPLL